jgi:hypothetical protein
MGCFGALGQFVAITAIKELEKDDHFVEDVVTVFVFVYLIRGECSFKVLLI